MAFLPSVPHIVLLPGRFTPLRYLPTPLGLGLKEVKMPKLTQPVTSGSIRTTTKLCSQSSALTVTHPAPCGQPGTACGAVCVLRVGSGSRMAPRPARQCWERTCLSSCSGPRCGAGSPGCVLQPRPVLHCGLAHLRGGIHLRGVCEEERGAGQEAHSGESL